METQEGGSHDSRRDTRGEHRRSEGGRQEVDFPVHHLAGGCVQWQVDTSDKPHRAGAALIIMVREGDCEMDASVLQSRPQ